MTAVNPINPQNNHPPRFATASEQEQRPNDHPPHSMRQQKMSRKNGVSTSLDVSVTRDAHVNHTPHNRINYALPASCHSREHLDEGKTTPCLLLAVINAPLTYRLTSPHTIRAPQPTIKQKKSARRPIKGIRSPPPRPLPHFNAFPHKVRAERLFACQGTCLHMIKHGKK